MIKQSNSCTRILEKSLSLPEHTLETWLKVVLLSMTARMLWFALPTISKSAVQLSGTCNIIRILTVLKTLARLPNDFLRVYTTGAIVL